MSDFRRRLMCKKNESDLPSGYTKLNYLESTGTQYIDTNYTIKNLPITVETSFELTSIISQNLFGTDYKNKGSYFVPFVGGDKFISCYDYKLETASMGKLYFAKFLQNKNDLSKMEIKLNDNTYSVNVKITSLPVNSNYQIFAANNKFIAHYKCNYHRLYEDNKMVFNLFPALDKNNKPCLYDTVSKQPFYNQGTGEFLYG